MKNQISFAVLVIVAFASISCQTSSRKPASEINAAEVHNVYGLQNTLNILEDEKQRLERLIRGAGGPVMVRRERPEAEAALEVVKGRIAATEASLRRSTAALSSSASSASAPQLTHHEYRAAWRHQAEKFEIASLEPYLFAGNLPTRNFFMATQDVQLYELRFGQSVTNERGSLDAEVSCDKPFSISSSRRNRSGEEYLAHQVARLEIAHRSRSSRTRLQITDPGTKCVFKFRNSARSQTWAGVNLIPEAQQYGELLKFTRLFHACSLPQTTSLVGPEKFFLTRDYSSLTCPQQAPIRISGRPIEGLTERIKLLTGSDLPQSVIDARNPYVDLDFSRAPRLDVIVVSSLVFRSDFYGRLLSQALIWHARRGAVVRILTSKPLELAKDRRMFQQMMEASDNIKVQSYEFDSTTGRLGGQITEKHRVSHTKIFATYSRSQPEASVVILGGRNTHEAYIFNVAVERIGLSDLVDYFNGEDPFIFYRDVEAIVPSHSFADTVISHYLTFWHRQPNAFIRSISLNLPTAGEASANYFSQSDQAPLVRHILSLPYKDDRELNDFYAELLDSAEREIKITTPYFLPTKKLGKALERAVQRGVEVSIITKSNLAGDNPQFDFITTAANRIAINRYWDKLKVYDYRVERSLLHSKLILIDGKLSVIGSVNLNRRSFYHDVENAMVVYSPQTTQEFLRLYDDFLASSSRVEGEQRVGFLNRLLVGVINSAL